MIPRVEGMPSPSPSLSVYAGAECKVLTDLKRPSQAAILDFLNDHGSSNDEERESEEEASSTAEKTPEFQPLTTTPVWKPIPWEPPEAWECPKGKKELPASFKTRGLGLPFRPAKPRRTAEMEILDERAPDE